MRFKVILILLFVAVACRRESTLQREQEQYDVVNEGAASGVSSTINGPGEAPPPLATTNTNADTTTAFTLPNIPPGSITATTPGTIAGTMPPAAGGVTYPAAPVTRPRPSVPATPPAVPPPAAPPPAVTDTATQQDQPPSTDTAVTPPPTDTAATDPPPPSEEKPKPPATDTTTTTSTQPPMD